MLSVIPSALRFFWRASAGYRLRPWRSPYLRWRLETFTGKPARDVRLRDFLHLLRSEHRQMIRFLRWTAAIQRLAAGRRTP